MSFTANLDDIIAENRNKLLGKHPSWERVRLKDVAVILNGFPFESERFSKETGTPLLRIRDILPGKTETFFDGDYDEAFLVRRGDIVVGMDGDFNCTAWPGEPALLNQRVCKLTPDESRYSKQFLRYVLPGYLSAINDHTPSVTVKHLSSRTVSDIPLPLPPLPEQRRIVAEIEKQFTRLEAGVAALRRVQANLHRYRAAVLKAACEGRLVPTEAELQRQRQRTTDYTDHSDKKSSAKSASSAVKFESGAQLLQRILKHRREAFTRRGGVTGKGKYKEPAAPDTANLPALPDGWCWAQFGLLGDDPFSAVQTGPFGAQLHNTEFTESGVPVIAVGNLTGTGFTEDGLYYITPKKAQQLSRYNVNAGDVLFARSGATLGKVCVTPQYVKDWRMTGHILRARLNTTAVLPEFAVFALAGSPAVRKQVFGNVRGVTRPGYNTTLLESICIPLPPVAEQERIVAEVERRLSVVEELSALVTANLQRATRLRQSILQQAFEGKLARNEE